MIKKHLTSIKNRGQQYLDVPQMRDVSKPKFLAVSCAALVGHPIPVSPQFLDHYVRDKLAWKKPKDFIKKYET